AAHLELRIPICDACRTALNEYRRSMPGIVAYKRRYGRATSRALSRLKVAHREEFARFFHEELAKVMTEADEDGLLPE
ncbi:MAG: hypothetical protein GWO24_13295, partial [Akkermansiaceae bacterium]|nr:hypothetical protein [Akkermansiaceae bacterium]